MRFLPVAVLALATVLLSSTVDRRFVVVVAAKKPSRTRPATASGRGTTRRPPSAFGVGDGGQRSMKSSGRPPVSRRRPPVYEEEEEDEEDGFDDEFDDDDVVEPADDPLDEEEEMFEEAEEEFDLPPPKSKRSPASRGSSRRGPPPRSSRRSGGSGGTASSRKRPPPRRYEEDDYDDEYAAPPPRRPSSSRRRGPPPPRSGAGRRAAGGGRVVPYAKPGAGQNAAATFTRGWETFKKVMPDPSTVKGAALSGISAARHTTSQLSSNIYREVKGLTSSELEQVMLKATRPDDSPVKGKHVERLVGVTYQINSRYDIYDAVLRKLWSKMAENDWRTTVKALYILHRFSADGSPEHAPALKARLRELRRTRDPKRKDKYFNSKQLLAGDSNPDNIRFRAFMSRYAHYVLLRAQCFSGMFEEIASPPKATKKSGPKPITATSLRAEHLNAAEMLLKAGVVCQLKEGEECENTAIACERVVSDMIGLTAAVAMSLNRALKDARMLGADPVLIKKWCVFYSEELLPQTKAMIKKSSTKLDAFGLFLPSRMGTSVSPDLLDRGLNLDEDEEPQSVAVSESGDVAVESDEIETTRTKSDAVDQQKDREGNREKEVDDGADDDDEAEEEVEEEADFDDEYEYEEEEYYDEED